MLGIAFLRSFAFSRPSDKSKQVVQPRRQPVNISALTAAEKRAADHTDDSHTGRQRHTPYEQLAANLSLADVEDEAERHWA
jgi:hypothetical protein